MFLWNCYIFRPQTNKQTDKKYQMRMPLIIVSWMTSALTIILHFVDCTECCALLVTIPVAVRCSTWVCSRSIAGLASSNPAKDMDFHLLLLLCRVGRSLCDELITRSQASYAGVCPIVCDLSNLKNEAA
jgi:hypothetical protein